jgi:murein DD-endopeptidase MepM/ murein hydrolase activator NlpD
VSRTKSETIRHDVRTFGAGAACGFLGGAVLAFAVMWQHGDAIGSVVAKLQRVKGPTVSDEWKDAVDSADGAIRPSERPVPTTGAARGGEPTVGPLPESAAELRDRDLQVPVPGVHVDQLSSQFTDARDGRRHEALDIAAPRNTPVVAVEDGRIARLFLSKAGGITIYQFDPTERYCYYYAHLERYADGLREGQTVRRGETIGFVGTSGNAPKNTPHLHFAVFRLTPDKHWWEGTPIDPYQVLR